MSEKKVTYIDCTPTWSGVLPLYIHFLEHGNAKQRELAKEELVKMAKLADNYVRTAQ